jgi:ParB family chromosome partitioning protein
MMNNKKGLGKGLAALMGEAKMHYSTASTSKEESEFGYIKISNIAPNEDQPRKTISQDSLNELANSIIENGVLQPILLQKIAENDYRIIAGERRWRAAQIAGLDEIPAIVKKYNDSQEFEIALIENIQRQDLNSIEEASGYLRLIEEFGYTQEQIAKALGKSRSHIANTLRLNTLPQPVQEQIAKGLLSMGHAKVLVGIDTAEEIALQIIEKDLNVRQTEDYVKSFHKKQNPQKVAKTSTKQHVSNTDPELLKLEVQLSEKLGARVLLQAGQDGGRITIVFDDFDQLDDILNKIG